MEKESRLLFGKILGEIYRFQRASDVVVCPASQGRIYALLNGFEGALERELEVMGCISDQQVKAVTDSLLAVWQDKNRLNHFKGYYDLENELQRRNISREEAIKILTYLKANHQFVELIEKMNSPHSPSECKCFDLDELYSSHI